MFMGEFLIFSFVNLALFLLVFVFFLRKPVKEFFLTRSDNAVIKKSQLEGEYSLAEGVFRKLTASLKNIQVEIKGIVEREEKEGEKEGKRLISEAEKLSERLIKQAFARADGEVKKRNRSFRQEIINKSIREAASLIKNSIRLEDQISLGRAFLKRLGREVRING